MSERDNDEWSAADQEEAADQRQEEEPEPQQQQQQQQQQQNTGRRRGGRKSRIGANGLPTAAAPGPATTTSTRPKPSQKDPYADIGTSPLDCIVDLLVCPSDATILANPMPCNEDDEEEMRDLMAHANDDETEEEQQERMNAIRERRGPRFARRHVACSTNEEDAEFTLVAFEQFRPFIYLLAFYSFNFTIKTWTYLSFTRYWLEADAKEQNLRISDADAIIYVGALVSGWVCLLGVIIASVVINVFMSESEPAQTAADAQGQLIGSGLDGLLRMFHGRNTSSQLAVEDVERQLMQMEYKAQYATNKLFYYQKESETNRYFTFTEAEAMEVQELQAIVHEYERGEYRITSRRTQLLRAVSALLWFCDIWMFTVDLNMFLENRRGVEVSIIINLFIGVVAGLFPPWILYQKIFMKVATKIFM